MHAEFLGESRFDNRGQRVVVDQRLMKQAGDVFLGWQRAPGMDGVQHNFCLRQLCDWKGSVEAGEMVADAMAMYGETCAWSRARAHARSGDSMAIAVYLGSDEAFERAIVEYAEGYADGNERDHAALSEAVSVGRIVAQHGR